MIRSAFCPFEPASTCRKDFAIISLVSVQISKSGNLFPEIGELWVGIFSGKPFTYPAAAAGAPAFYKERQSANDGNGLEIIHQRRIQVFNFPRLNYQGHKGAVLMFIPHAETQADPKPHVRRQVFIVADSHHQNIGVRRAAGRRYAWSRGVQLIEMKRAGLVLAI